MVRSMLPVLPLLVPLLSACGGASTGGPGSQEPATPELPATRTPEPATQAAAPASPETTAPVVPTESIASGAAAPGASAPKGDDPQPVLFTLTELAARSDLWPPKVGLREAVSFPDAKFRVGDELGLQAIRGSEVVLDTGRFLFEHPAEKTDVLERASRLAAVLTPEQLALTWTELARRSELWPLRLQTRVSLSFQNGTQVPAGREVILRTFENGLLSVYDRVAKDHFQLEPQETDILTRARERVLQPAGEPFFVRSVAAALEDSVEGESPLSDAEYLLVYAGRRACPRCAAFVPELTDFLARAKTQYGGFEVLFYSQDTDAEEARAHAAEKRLPGRAIAFDRRFEAAGLAGYSGQLLPLAFLFDRSGTLLARNHPNGGSPNAAGILADLENRLKARSDR